MEPLRAAGGRTGSGPQVGQALPDRLCALSHSVLETCFEVDVINYHFAGKNGGSEGLSNLPKLTQPGWGAAETQAALATGPEASLETEAPSP